MLSYQLVFLFTSFSFIPILPECFLIQNFTGTLISPTNFFTKIVPPCLSTDLLGGFEKSGFQNFPDSVRINYDYIRIT